MTDERGPQPKTPELDRRSEVLPKAEVLTEFVDWMRADGLILCRLVPSDDDEWNHGQGNQVLMATYESFEEMFERFFGLDGNKIEAERRALLDWLAKAPKR
jgi:hypothetical protein